MASEEVMNFLNRMDPDLAELADMEGFEETSQGIYEETQKEAEKLRKGEGCDLERIAFLLTMQAEAINRLVDEVEQLRPSIRFITSVLLGNTEQEDE